MYISGCQEILDEKLLKIFSNNWSKSIFGPNFVKVLWSDDDALECQLDLIGKARPALKGFQPLSLITTRSTLNQGAESTRRVRPKNRTFFQRICLQKEALEKRKMRQELNQFLIFDQTHIKSFQSIVFHSYT